MAKNRLGDATQKEPSKTAMSVRSDEYKISSPRAGVIHNSGGRVTRCYDPRALNPSRGQLINGSSHQAFCVFLFCAKERFIIRYTAIDRHRPHHIKDASCCACWPSSRSYCADDCLR